MQQNDFPLPTALNTDAWRLGVHATADQIEEWVTGQRGIAATRVAFVRDGRVWVVDSDGANARAVMPRGLSPSWHPSGRYLAYHVIDDDRIRLSVTDLVTGSQRSLTNLAGTLDMTPAVSPDGRSVVFSRSVEATASQSDLFVMPFDGGPATRITVARGSINLAPSWSPDSRRITYESDRSGRKEIYISDADGTNVSLLTADAYGEKNRRADPSWSPDGRLVAFSSEVGGRRQILTINLRDRSIAQVTSEGNNHTPAWAPDGRHLVFTSTRGGTEQVWVADIETGRTRQLTRGAGARFPTWSPRLSATP
jgi:TolB protein